MTNQPTGQVHEMLSHLKRNVEKIVVVHLLLSESNKLKVKTFINLLKGRVSSAPAPNDGI